MRRFTRLILILGLAGSAFQHASAFTLLGPSTVWMTHRLGYDVNPVVWPIGQAAGVGGPMTIGEEYRVNIPTLTYGYSASFLNYFGQRGVTEIDKAVAIMNELPSMDTININDYPLVSQRINHRAVALGLRDIRSTALSALVNQLGLTDPTRWVFTLRNRWTTEASTNYYVIKRNFDPDTLQHSSFINGQLWTYTTILEVDNGAASIVINEPVDPLALGGLINAPVASGIGGNDLLSLGGFWTGLTRDDVGGLRYMYRTANFNIENAPTNSFAVGFGAPVAGTGGSPWTIPIVGTNGGVGVIPGASTNFVDQALRPGLGTVRFERAPLESGLIGFVSNTVTYVDRYVTNGAIAQQNLVRVQTVPDIVFDAGDLQGGDTEVAFITYSAGSLAWNVGGDGTTTFGPGTIPPSTGGTPSLNFTFNTVGPTFASGIFGGTPFLSEANNQGRFFLWASFDGSMEEPFIYPLGANTDQIEELVLTGGGIGFGVVGGPLIDVWTPAAFVYLPPGTAVGGGVDGGADGGGFTDDTFFP